MVTFTQKQRIIVDVSAPSPLPSIPVSAPLLFTSRSNSGYGTRLVEEVNGRRGLGVDYTTGPVAGNPPCLWASYQDAGDYGIVGLGGPFYVRRGMGGYSSFRKPIYYKKGAEEWGTYYDIDSLYNAVGITNDVLPGISITHQPNILIVQQERPSSLQFRLLDVVGHSVLNLSISATVHRIALPDLPAGIYPYILEDHQGKFKTGKLLISKF